MARKVVGSAAVRTWARENGHTVGDRGRFSADLVKAFEKATGQRYETGHVPTVEVKGTRVTDKNRKVPVRKQVTLAEVRAAAAEAGVPVGARGKVPAAVLSAFASGTLASLVPSEAPAEA